jgi:hypothetical protein
MAMMKTSLSMLLNTLGQYSLCGREEVMADLVGLFCFTRAFILFIWCDIIEHSGNSTVWLP